MSVLVWKRIAPVKWADAWEERLRFLGMERLVFTEIKGMRSIRIEAYGVTRGEGEHLLKEFGGKLHELRDADWTSALTKVPPPLNIRGKLLVVSQPGQVNGLAGSELIIPGGIAFGTGHHATTSMCLRMLCDVVDALHPEPWSMLDIGTGTGILALAAMKLGARNVLGTDFDPQAVRTCKENARVNRATRRVRFERQDVLSWTPESRWDVVAANLYSSVLMQAAPTIVRCLKPQGRLLLSGILRSQEDETLGAFHALGMSTVRVVRKGKWICALAMKNTR